MSEHNQSNLGTEVVIAIRCPCNFSCHYCVSANIHQKTILHSLEKIRRYYQDIDSFTVTSIECGTGEPTLHPQLREILDICTDYGVVSIPTNNSLKPEKWMPKRSALLYVRAALHPQNEQKIDSFLGNLLYLKDHGAKVSVIFVAHPERMEKIPEYQAFFLKHDIQIDLTSFIGSCQGKKYPESYTDKERTLLKLDTPNRWWYHKLFPEITIRDFFGIPCLAGYRSLYIGEQSELIRCTHDQRPINKPFKKAIPCMVHQCGCELLLEDVNTSDEGFWNNWLSFAGRESIPVKHVDQEKLYRMNKDIYWELMQRYGKIKDTDPLIQVASHPNFSKFIFSSESANLITTVSSLFCKFSSGLYSQGFSLIRLCRNPLHP